jgi:hypothetical protein
MADLILKTANRVEVAESVIQDTRVAAEAIVAGAPVRDDGNGKFTNANATNATEAAVYGIATRSVPAGMPVTAIRKGVMDGWANLPAHGAAVYLSDTDGRLADAAGTVSVRIGTVIPGNANTAGAAADKLLFVDL